MTEHIDAESIKFMDLVPGSGIPCSDVHELHIVSDTQRLIRQECAAIADLLVKKNQDYGNSFADPVQIFSKSDPEEQINVRIDDKLKRLMNRGDKNISEDTEADLIGYLILKRVYRKIKAGRGE